MLEFRNIRIWVCKWFRVAVLFKVSGLVQYTKIANFFLYIIVNMHNVHIKVHIPIQVPIDGTEARKSLRWNIIQLYLSGIIYIYICGNV